MILGVLKTIWRELKVAEDFKDNWYVYACQQGTHLLLGMMMTLFVSFFFVEVFGELPYKEYMWLGIAAFYIVWEVFIQNYKSFWDSVEDFFFVVCYGAGVSISAFSEKQASHNTVSFDIETAIPFAMVAILHLFYGCASRILEAGNNER